jgi:hypothetical protein
MSEGFHTLFEIMKRMGKVGAGGGCLNNCLIINDDIHTRLFLHFYAAIVLCQYRDRYCNNYHQSVTCSGWTLPAWCWPSRRRLTTSVSSTSSSSAAATPSPPSAAPTQAYTVRSFFSFIFFSRFYTYCIIQYSSRLSSRAGPDLAEW